MSIITKVSTSAKGIGEKAKKAAVKGLQKSADVIAAASQFSPEQIEKVDGLREQYLTQLPSPDDEGAIALIERNLGRIGIEVYQEYLPLLSEIYHPGDVNETSKADFDARNRIMYFDITRWVLDIDENYIDKLVNVYHVLSSENCSIALIYQRLPDTCLVELAVANNGANDSSVTKAYRERIIDAINGNFPAVELKISDKDTQAFGIGIPPCLSDQSDKSVAIVSNLAAEKSEQFISQSMEKLLDGIVPKDNTEEYTIVLLANPVHDQADRKNQLFQIASEITPYATWQTNYNVNELASISSGATAGIGAGVGFGGQRGNSQGIADSSSNTESVSDGVSTSNGGFTSGSVSSTTTVGASGTAKVPLVGEVNGHIDQSVSGSLTTGSNWSHSTQRIVSSAVQTGKTVSSLVNKASTISGNLGINFARSSNVSMQIGKSEGITQTNTNYTVQHTLQIIDEQVKRLEQCSALGMWEFAAYFISKSHVITNNAAHMYMALTQGENSYMTRGAVNMWHSSKDSESAKRIIDSVSKLQHPMFLLRDDLPEEEGWYMFPSLVNAATALSGRELAYALNFPRKSVSGLPVIESVSFGREVHRLAGDDSAGEKIQIGSVYHLRHDENISLSLDLDSLRSHTLITGSTGSGKSNTVYHLLEQFRRKGVKFLVIEPAKGEYKNIFGGYEGEVCVYGTNPLIMPPLQINPFSFPSNIHVLEHIDRLVEIFNACWPMYAAMPAVLKDAIEQCYIQQGWDMTNSCCGPITYPTMLDLLETLPRILQESGYSDDTKNDYTGALVTRIKSLTNGITGQIFCSETNVETEGAQLFDTNVIIDLSRVGSSETKSLIMGILVMKLQEYRLSSGGMNLSLKHVTVLEEAHNLLRKTSTSQTQESSNVQGKSVEMIANAIAEMRTYGEGFIIVDQAPGLLDESVIRNTNTKIALRLPDAVDREIVGKAEALTENQIRELAKLQQGVAAVYQNDWIEAVLCHFPRFPQSQERPFAGYDTTATPRALEHFFSRLFSVSDQKELSREDVNRVKDWIRLAPLSQFTKNLLNKQLIEGTLSQNEVSAVAYNAFDGSRIAALLEKATDEAEGIKLAKRAINSMYRINNELISTSVLKLTMDVIFKQLEPSSLEKRYRGIEIEGRVF